MYVGCMIAVAEQLSPYTQRTVVDHVVLILQSAPQHVDQCANRAHLEQVLDFEVLEQNILRLDPFHRRRELVSTEIA